MSMRIRFLPSDKTIAAARGTTILQAAREAGIPLASPCGGKGRCGRCLVLVGESRIPVLACETPAKPGMLVEIPPETAAQEISILSTGVSRRVRPSPNISKTRLTLPPPKVGDQRSDTRRILDGLKAAGIAASASPGGVAGIPRIPRESKWDLTAVLAGGDLVGLEPRCTEGSVYGMAYDVGTTTIVGYLIDLETGRQLAVASERNPQSAEGEDVVSRISFAAQSGRNLKKFQDEVVCALNSVLRRACREAEVEAGEVYEAVAVGNPCMISILLGVSPEGLTEAPYVAPFDDGQERVMPVLGIEGSEFGRLSTLPLISAFVGADTVAMVLAAGMDRGSATRLAIDIGTNGEMVLRHKGRLLAAAAAAGPAFEGWRISCGTQAVAGAIDHIWVADEALEFSTLGSGSGIPGLCGSAIADAVALMIEEAVVDPGGRLLTRDAARARLPRLSSRIRTADGDRRSFAIAEGISMTQGDIREVQLAKGAIRAGINILLSCAGITHEDIDEVLLAGAFGNYINRRSALSIGLLPPVGIDKIRSIGNAAGEGAKLALISAPERRRAKRIAESVEYLELSGRPGFEAEFAAGVRLG
jgi:uncharacterized 2Fe-2S/4Fe-4S cluster protein (DUF4445 family)